MAINLQYVGLDVHAETIAVAVAEPDGAVRHLGIIPNHPEAVAKLLRKVGPREHLRVCYEAGPCGYVLYWQLTRLGVACAVVAPTLIPTKAGDRIKTDRRDAERLARRFRAGDLPAVWGPRAATAGRRDPVRAPPGAQAEPPRARPPLPPPPPADGLQRHGAARALERERHPARGDHQDGQCPPAAGAGGGSMGVPAWPELHRRAQAPPNGPVRGHHGPRLESAAPLVYPVSPAPGPGQTEATRRDGDRAGVTGLYLGHRCGGRTGRRVRQVNLGNETGRGRGARQGASLLNLCAQAPAERAPLVRGGSRRITTMPACASTIREYQSDQPSRQPRRPRPGLRPPLPLAQGSG